MRTFLLSVGLLVSAVVTAAPQEPKVSCALFWQVQGDGITKDSKRTDSEELEIGKDATLASNGFNFTGLLQPSFLGTRLNGYKLSMKISQGESTAFRADYTQIGSPQSLGLQVGKESAMVNCYITAK